MFTYLHIYIYIYMIIISHENDCGDNFDTKLQRHQNNMHLRQIDKNRTKKKYIIFDSIE